jgi:hypothetical protein
LVRVEEIASLPFVRMSKHECKRPAIAEKISLNQESLS